MPVRTVCFLFAIALPYLVHAQEGKRPLFAAPKPKVVAPPTAAPPAAPTADPTTPKPVMRKRPIRRVDPMTAYMPTVKTAFSLRWGEAVTPLMKDFVPGNVSALFKLDAEGKVTDFTVTQNTSNEAFAKFCEQFVRETTFEKPPEKALAEGHVEIPFTFWIY